MKCINCDRGYERTTFDSVVTNFCRKAKWNESEMNPKFIVQFHEEIDTFITEILALDENLMDESEKEQVLAKVPENLNIDQIDAHFMLLHKIDYINIEIGEKIKSKTSAIRNATSFRCPSEYPNRPYFEDSFRAWLQNPAKTAQIKRIRTDFYVMQKTYDALLKCFNEEIKAMREITAGLKPKLEQANHLFVNLLESRDSKTAKEFIEQVIPILDEITRDKEDVFLNIENVQKILDYYNEQRLTWVEFLIGIKTALPSYPKEVKLDKLGIYRAKLDEKNKKRIQNLKSGLSKLRIK